ncbi:unnamed protein product [Lactuca saligna]|uniref:Uncharacterized protein n=1 Tax=Lactuca saligna TaxID=75948 RepID=A0AA35ZCZ2_LACSI|nr:unnamed protein product [Lactuca saligna]
MSLLQAIQAISFLSKKVLSTIIFFKDLIMFAFAPNANVIKGPHAHDSPIIVQANNVAFSNVIPKQFVNSRIKDFINYVKSCHLRYAFCNFPVLFYHKQVWYIDNHGIIIPIHSLSSNIINVAAVDGENNITQRMDNWIPSPYTVEYSDSKEDNNDADEEDVDDEEDELVIDRGEYLDQGMNSSRRLNKHIRFSSTSSSTPSAVDVI